MNNMTEEQEQNTQKTIVAFVAGLLVGGLLVWVFSGPSSTSQTDEMEKETASDMQETDSNNTDTSVTFSETDSVANTNTTQADDHMSDMEVGEGEISVSDQAAGNTVELDSAVFPNDEGWIGVRDYSNGNLGNILGVARFSKEQGLIPSNVSLVRSTVSGETYAVVFFTESGDREFSLADDVQIDSVMETFTAR